MRSRSLFLHVCAIGVIGLAALPRAPAAAQTSDIPAWLRAHVGTGEGQIAPVVLQRARALYRQKVREDAVNNPRRRGQ